MAEVKTSHSDRRGSHPPRDAPRSLGLVAQNLSGSNQHEIPGVAKGQVVERELHVVVGIPAATSAHGNLIAGVEDDFAFMVQLHFVFAPDLQRLPGQHQKRSFPSPQTSPDLTDSR
jgi:hypothetical protein